MDFFFYVLNNESVTFGQKKAILQSCTVHNIQNCCLFTLNVKGVQDIIYKKEVLTKKGKILYW